MRRLLWAVGLLVALGLALTAWMQPRSGVGDGSTGAGTDPGVIHLSPLELRKRMDQGDTLLINVHVPYEGQIPGTDLQIPFDKVEQYQNRLPADRQTPIAVYCLSGRMGAIAAAKLTALGYRRIVNLDGGMIAWDRMGLPLVDWQR